MVQNNFPTTQDKITNGINLFFSKI